jgi:hypothetical protein
VLLPSPHPEKQRGALRVGGAPLTVSAPSNCARGGTETGALGKRRRSKWLREGHRLHTQDREVARLTISPNAVARCDASMMFADAHSTG